MAHRHKLGIQICRKIHRPHPGENAVFQIIKGNAFLDIGESSAMGVGVNDAGHHQILLPAQFFRLGETLFQVAIASHLRDLFPIHQNRTVCQDTVFLIDYVCK